MTRFLCSLLAISLLLCTAGSARATFVVIDDFSNPTPGQFFIVNPVVGPSVNPLTITGPTGFGSTRHATMQVDVPNPLNPGVNALTGVLGGGTLDFNSNTFTQARAILRYDTFTGNSGNFYAQGLPFYLYVGFQNFDPGIDLSTNLPAASAPLDVAISTTTGNYFASFMLPQSAVPFEFSIPLSSLPPNVDLHSVTSLTLTINGGPNQRQRVDFLMSGVTLEAIPSPAPPTALFALVGVPVLAWIRRRRLS